MNIFRPFLLLCSMTPIVPACARSQISARKIAPVEVDYVGSSDMRISGDGRFLSFLSLPGEKGSDCIVFDRRTHKTTMLPGSSRAEPLCFSRDGRRLWVWGLHLDERLPGLRVKPSDHQFLALYDLRRGRYTRYFQIPDSNDGVVGASVLSRDERNLIYSTDYGWIVAISTRTGKQTWKRRVQDRGNEPVSVELSPDGSRFLRLDEDENGSGQRAQVVSTRSGRVLSTMRLKFASSQGLRSAFDSGRFAPRGSMIALFQQETQQWAFFDARTRRLRWKMGGPSRSSEGELSWQWSPDARFVGVSGPKSFEVRDARNGRVLRVCPQLQDATLAFSPDGSRVYALEGDDTGFGTGTVLWQWRLFPSFKQRRADARFMARLRRREERFALSKRHIHESLIQAARGGDARRVAFLLERGANIETLDGRGDSPLVNAVNGNDVYGGPHRYFDTTKLLLARGAHIGKRGPDLMASAAADSPAMLRLLFAHGASVNGDASRYGVGTPLHGAANLQQVENVRFLLAHGANSNARDAEGDTPLMEAINYFSPSRGVSAAEDSLAIARLLIAHGADVNIRNKVGQSALDMVQTSDMRTVLQKAGAKP